MEDYYYIYKAENRSKAHGSNCDKLSFVDRFSFEKGGLSYGAIFSIIDGTNCSPKAVLACGSVNLVFISFSVQ